MNVNVFNSVTSPRVLSNHCLLHYSLTMPVGFNFNSTFGLNPQVGGIKIVTVYKRSIFQVEWLIATLISLSFHLLVCPRLFCASFEFYSFCIRYSDTKLFTAGLILLRDRHIKTSQSPASHQKYSFLTRPAIAFHANPDKLVQGERHWNPDFSNLQGKHFWKKIPLYAWKKNPFICHDFSSKCHFPLTLKNFSPSISWLVATLCLGHCAF